MIKINMRIEVRENGVPAPREDVALVQNILNEISLDPEILHMLEKGGWKPAVSISGGGNKTHFSVIKIKVENGEEIRSYGKASPASSIVLGSIDFEGTKLSEVGVQKFANQMRAVAGVRRQLELPHINPIQD